MSSKSLPNDVVVQAALRVAARLGRDVADTPVAAIAGEAGMSRSTLLRRLGGSRAALDEAVRAAGVDPGGQPPVRTRALDAAAALISESGLASVTFDGVAERARCSVDSLYAVFGSRDALLGAVFERHSPILDIEDFVEQQHGDLAAAVQQFYRLLAEALQRPPRLAPAILAEALSRPTSPAVASVLRFSTPRLLESLGRWLTDEVAAGHLRDLPLPLLVQQFLAPLLVHLLLRPALDHPMIHLPDIDEACAVFAEAFVRAAGTGH